MEGSRTSALSGLWREDRAIGALRRFPRQERCKRVRPDEKECYVISLLVSFLRFLGRYGAIVGRVGFLEVEVSRAACNVVRDNRQKSNEEGFYGSFGGGGFVLSHFRGAPLAVLGFYTMPRG